MNQVELSVRVKFTFCKHFVDSAGFESYIPLAVVNQTNHRVSKMLIRSLLTALMVLPSFGALAQEPGQSSFFVSELPSTYHSGWARLNQDGYFRSRVIGFDGVVEVGANVTIRQNGNTVATAKTNANGTFETSGLHTGIYEVRVDGKRGCGVVALRLMPAKGSSDSVTEIYCSSLSSSWYDKMVSQFSLPQELSAASPESILGGQSIPSRQSRRVLIDDGAVRGQVAFASGSSSPESLIVQLYQNGKRVAETTVNAAGEFFVPVAEEGYYDVFIGGGANSLMGIEAVNSSFADNSDGTFKYVSLNQSGAASCLCCPVASSHAGGAVSAGIAGPVHGGGFATSNGLVGGGGFGGGAGGGGGLGGGGLGIGGLAGIAGLAVGIPALADDDSAVATPIAP